MADSASVVDGDVVCDECLIYSERLDQDEENGMESLIELICHKGEDGARSYLVQHDDFDLIGEQRWSEAAIKAARWAA
jgi:hypothetical protein